MSNKTTYAVTDTDTGLEIRWHALESKLREWCAWMNAGESRVRYTYGPRRP